MAFKAKAKGNSFERQTAHILSDWTSEKFWRIPNSGALRWKGQAWVYGDLMIPESFPVSVIECKHHKTADLDDVIRLKPQPSNILGWWSQALEDCDRCTAETNLQPMPILVYKGNRRPPRICFLASFAEHLNFKQSSVTVNHTDYPAFVIYDLLEFVQNVTYYRFKQAYEKFTQACGVSED